MQEQPDIEVTLTVKVRRPNNFVGEDPVAERTFTTGVDTDGDLFEVARANVNALSNSAKDWLMDEGQSR
jgi:hypothetical protein